MFYDITITREDKGIFRGIGTYKNSTFNTFIIITNTIGWVIDPIIDKVDFQNYNEKFNTKEEVFEKHPEYFL